ncbi:MAG TPA: helix-turn-helix transcriptional regulator [Verrucomicrobiae bacterium]
MTNKQATSPPDRFARLLRKALAGSGLSLRAAAAKTGISPTYLSLLLNGERGAPAEEIITNLERALDIPSGRLFDAAALADSTTKSFLKNEQARPFMRSLERLSNAQVSQVLAVASKLAEKYHPQDK